MNILVLNGSPRSGASNTMKLTTTFLEGMGRHSIEIYGEKIKHPEAAASWHMVALFGKKYYQSCERWATEMLKTLSEREDL